MVKLPVVLLVVLPRLLRSNVVPCTIARTITLHTSIILAVGYNKWAFHNSGTRSIGEGEDPCCRSDRNSAKAGAERHRSVAMGDSGCSIGVLRRYEKSRDGLYRYRRWILLGGRGVLPSRKQR